MWKKAEVHSLEWAIAANDPKASMVNNQQTPSFPSANRFRWLPFVLAAHVIGILIRRLNNIALIDYSLI